MPTLLFTFANSETNRLPTLTQEYDGVNEAVRTRFANGDFVVISEPLATRKKAVDLLRAHKENLCLFMFSGHAGRDQLVLEDGEGLSEGIAELLRNCSNLKLVILNGCSTAGQVNLLLSFGVPMVIATHAPVGDETATQFSITFFKELAQERKSVREAFDLATDTAKVYGKVATPEVTSRGLGMNPEMQPLWGLYYATQSETLLDIWRLPEKKVADVSLNEDLKTAIQGIFDEQLKDTEGEAKPQDKVLQRLPYPISEPIRKLLASGDGSAQGFYDSPSNDRAVMLLYAYRSLINFMTFSLLGQLWKEKLAQQSLEVSGLKESLKKWLFGDFSGESTRSLLPLYTELISLFRANGIPFFFEELEGILINMSESGSQDSVVFLEEKLASSGLQKHENLAQLCHDLEEHLAVLLYCYGFLVNYSLTSVKDIEVLFYMHQLEARYEHNVVRLQQQVTALEDSIETGTVYYKTASILLRSTKDKTHYLYLSPFLIDENAYTKTTKANLRYFVCFVNSPIKKFYFRHVSKPKDEYVLVIEKKTTNVLARIKGGKNDEPDYYPLINEQFNAFSKTVLGQSLDSL